MTDVLSRLWTNRQPYLPFYSFFISLSLFHHPVTCFSGVEIGSCEALLQLPLWAVIRGWGVTVRSGLFGNDGIQWCGAMFCSHNWQHIVLWGLQCPCAMECPGTEGLLGREPRRGGHIWASAELRVGRPFVLQLPSVCKPHGSSLFMVLSLEWNWLYLSHRFFRAEGVLLSWKSWSRGDSVRHYCSLCWSWA